MTTIDITTDQLKERALEWINQIRQEHGLEALSELPKGKPGRTSECVLAEAARGLSDLTCQHDSRRYRVLKEDEPVFLSFAHKGRTANHEVPREVAEFLRRFDGGEFPELAA